jgi:hypothetical protein
MSTLSISFLMILMFNFDLYSGQKSRVVFASLALKVIYGFLARFSVCIMSFCPIFYV